MNIEGIPPSISPQFLQALATGLLTLVVAIGLLELLGRLWRRFLWSRCGSSIERVAHELGTQPVARWTAWTASNGDVWVSWSGGLLGARTKVYVGDASEVAEALLDADGVQTRIAALRGARATAVGE